MRLFLCGGVAIEAGGRRLPDAVFAGRQGRLVFAYLVCERHRSVPREELAELLWGESLPSSWSSSLSAVVSKLRRMLTDAGLDGPAALASAYGSYRLHLPDDTWIDWEVAGSALERAERAVHDGQTESAVAAAAEVEEIARRGFIIDDCLWANSQRERLRDMHVRAAHVRAEAHLLTGEQRRAIDIARDALGLDELREASYRVLMRALAAAGERGEALRVWERCRTLLVEELGTDPATETEAVYLSILGAVPPPAPSLPSGVVTFLLTDIVDSTGLWERNPTAMSSALERHDQVVAHTVGANAGVVLKAKLEGDATVSVFRRASAGALAALALREALLQEPWPEGAAPAVRMALHTGEAIERDGDYFGPALNRAARLRGLADGGQILVSQAVAEVVRDYLPDGTVLRSLGARTLRGLTRDEHVFELAPLTADDIAPAAVERPALPMVLAGRGPFVGRDVALDALATEWATAMAGTARAVFIAGEPGVGKTRLAGESARRAYDQGALVLYGRCDEELEAPYQPFAEALRALVGCLGPRRLRSVRGVEELARLVPDVADLVPGLAAPTQASPDTERYALFDAFARLLTAVSTEVPVLVVVDDLHWAAKPTLLLLRHLLRSAEGARILVIGTYRHTDLARTHPLAGTLADLHSDGTAERFTLTGLPAGDVTEYLSASGYDDEHLGAALSTVTSGNPFFVIEVLRHVEETGGAWNPSTLPQGIREAVGRRLSRLSDAANDALLVAAVAGSRFSVALVERVLDRDLVDAIGEACHAGLIVEEEGGWCRFDHALVRQSLLSEIASLKLVRLHQRIAEALEADGATSNDDHLADLARHYFECALAGGAAKAVDYSRRAAEQATARLAYEVAADFYDRALQAADIDATGVSDDAKAELLLARCEALLAAGDPTSAIAVVEQLQRAARASPRLSAWATCFAGQLAMLTHPEQLDATAQDVAAAAEQFALMDEPDGEAKAHTVRASCLARLGRVADCEAALDRALTAGRRAGDPRRVNAVLAGAPLAALWGPSPVARASGRCLDVVRVLRITTGSPAVEAVALRCQAVLEALRGRADAARRMLGSAHRSLESLGHTHGLLETDLFTGIVELLAGEPAAAETPLRRAYEGFVTRGVGVDAAQAAALLARAVLAQGRVDAALALTDDSERLAGVDLQSAIAWRSVRAEALAQQGRTADALDAARAAVALAEPTDALIYQADAHLSLAIVLRATGSVADAETEARRAIDLYQRKGATARVDAVQSILNPPAPTLSAPLGQPATRRRVRPNQATEVEARGAGPFGDQTVDQWLDRIADDYVEVDHRTQVTTDRDAYERTLRMWARMERFTCDVEALASLGDRHALVRSTYHMEGTPIGRDRTGSVGAAEVVILEVARTDDTGCIVRAERFDYDELSLAMARLVELHADGELPPDRHDERYQMASYLADAAPFTWSEDAVLVDHRTAGLGTLEGRDVIRAAGRVLRGVAKDLRRRITDVLGSTERVFLVEVSSEGSDEQGGPFEMAMLAVGEFDDDGYQRRAEWYELESLDEALARFDELVGAPAVAHMENMASVEFRRLYDALLRRDFEWTDATTADNAAVDDRRSLFRYRAEGHDAVVAWLRSVVAAGVTDIEVDVLATRGERLVLERELHRGRDGESEALVVSEFAPDRRWLGCAGFDSDDLDAAFDELDARYAAGEAAPCAEAWAMTAAANAAYNRRDWDALEGLLADAFVTVDHRTAGWGTLEREASLATLHGLVELAPDVRIRNIAVVRQTVNGGITVTRLSGTDVTGGPFEIEYLALRMTGGSRFVRYETYAADDLAAASERLEALTTPTADSHLSNTAVRHWAELMACFRARDWDGLAARLADDATTDDRRSLVGRVRGVYEGRDACVAMWREFAAVGVTDVVGSAVATRGERLLLQRALFVGGPLDGEGEVEVLLVLVFDDHGRYLAGVSFDPDDLDTAVAELDARYAAGEGAPLGELTGSTMPDGYLINDAVRCATEVLSHFVRSDWDYWYTDVVAEDVVLDDRRRYVGFTAVGRDEVIKFNKAVADVGVTGASTIPIATRGDRLALLRHVYSGAAGEVELLNVWEFDVDGRWLALISFDPDDLDAALAELDERFAVGEAAPYPDEWWCLRTFIDAATRNDSGALASLAAEDFAVIDQRSMGLGEVGARAMQDYVSSFHAFVADARARYTAIPRIADGRVICVLLLCGTTAEGAEIEVPYLGVLSLRGRKAHRLQMFSLEQTDAAYEVFEALVPEFHEATTSSHAADTSALENTASVISQQFFDLALAHDWQALSKTVAPHFVRVDQREGLRSEYVGRDQGVAELQFIFAVVHDLATAVVATRGDRLVLTSIQGSGTTDDGGKVGVELLWLGEIDADDQIVRVVWFDPGDLATAAAELDDRYAAELAPDDADAWMASRRLIDSYNARDTPGVRASLSDDCVIIDERMTGWGTLDADAFVGHLQELIDVAPDAYLTCVVVHSTAPNGSVVRFRVTGTIPGGGPFEMLFETTSIVRDAKLVRLDLLPEGQVDEALRRLSKPAP